MTTFGNERKAGSEYSYSHPETAERDTGIAEALRHYRYSAQLLASDYEEGMTWLAQNPKGFNEQDFTEATSVMTNDVSRLLGEASTAIESTFRASNSELLTLLHGQDSELITVLVDHARNPEIGSMHPSIYEGFKHFSSPEAQRVANAYFDGVRLDDLKRLVQDPTADSTSVREQIDEFSTGAARQAATAFVNFAQSERAAKTGDAEGLAVTHDAITNALRAAAMDGILYRNAKAAREGSQKAGLGNALAARHVVSMSGEAIQGMALSLMNVYYVQREASPDDKHIETWLRSGWDDGFKEQQRKRQEKERARSSRNTSSGSGGGRSSSSQGGSQNRQRRTRQARGEHSAPNDERGYDIGSREPSTAEERELAERVKSSVASFRQYRWFEHADPDKIIDLQRFVTNTRQEKGNEGIKDRTVCMRIRRLAEQEHKNLSHPSHTWVTYIDAMVQGKYGKSLQLPF